ncbi:hypothetical protein [Actinophytocola sp.]|uniref:hypothetical protein n=1 Tax=Actinophytocola sp. TaxID=1872138 RepID=UPI003899F69E
MEMKHNRGPRRRAVLAAALGAGLLMPMTPALADAQAGTGDARGTGVVCGMVPLPTPAGATSSVNGGDLTGRYLVGQVDYPDRRVGAVWRDGRYAEIDASSISGVQVDYRDVNRYGVVVGERMTDNQSFHTDAFIYRDGKFTFLPAPRAGDSVQAIGINSRGDVVGNSFGNGNGWLPVVWPADRPGTVRALPLPAGLSTGALASGIDEDGSVAGILSPYPPGTPYLWPAKGKPHALPVPAGSIGGQVAAIQGGMVAGDVYAADDATRPTLWNLATGGLTMHEAVRSGSISVNARGTIGGGGVIVHADGRVSTLAAGSFVSTIADTGVAAGSTAQFNGQAVRWLGC